MTNKEIAMKARRQARLALVCGVCAAIIGSVCLMQDEFWLWLMNCLILGASTVTAWKNYQLAARFSP